jgi:hypothetical protein
MNTLHIPPVLGISIIDYYIFNFLYQLIEFVVSQSLIIAFLLILVFTSEIDI